MRPSSSLLHLSKLSHHLVAQSKKHMVVILTPNSSSSCHVQSILDTTLLHLLPSISTNVT